MHELTTQAPAGTASDEEPSSDRRYETRIAWIASLWAAMAVLAAAVAIWDGWRAGT